MTFLPIVERELRVAARLTGTFKRRMLAAGVAAVIAIMMLLFGGFVPSPSSVGRAMFGTLSYLILAFCLMEGLRKTADCLSEERREGTLGLLFLTDLKGYDVVLGKLAATSLDSFYALLAALPILALALLLGGVLPAEYWRRALSLTNLLSFSLSAGIAVSARSRLARRAVHGATWLILSCIAVPLLPGFDAAGAFSPGYAFFHAPESLYRVASATWWHSLLLTQCICWALLVWASFSVSRLQEKVVENAGWRRRRSGEEPLRRARRRELLKINPVLWLAERNLGGRRILWVFIAAAGVVSVGAIAVADSIGAAALIGCALVANFLLKGMVASRSCRCMAEARANNALEMLLCTPLTVEKITQGQMLALRRMFRGPIIACLSLQIVGLFAAIIIGSSDIGERVGELIAASIAASMYLGVTILDFIAVAWAGMWFGLSAKDESQAVSKTIVYVLVLPLFGALFWCFGLPVFIVWPIIWLFWAQQKVQSEFRRLAGQQFNASQRNSSWWPFQTAGYGNPRSRASAPGMPAAHSPQANSGSTGK